MLTEPFVFVVIFLWAVLVGFMVSRLISSLLNKDRDVTK